MKAIKPYAKIYDEKDKLKKIEMIGRTCYKSEGKIKSGSAKKFVANLIKRGHEAMLEHASFIFRMDMIPHTYFMELVKDFETEIAEYKSFLRFTAENNRYIVSGNVRAWRDFMKASLVVNAEIPNFMQDFVFENPVLFPEYQDEMLFKNAQVGYLTAMEVSELEGLTEKLTHWDVTAKFVVDRGVSHEVVRHRPASFAQESTRYCNYAKDDFGGEITCIIPNFLSKGTLGWGIWYTGVINAEARYFTMLKMGMTAQEARGILPHSLKTELFMTANLAEWRHFFCLRAANMTGKAHPQMLEVSVPLLKDMDAFAPDTLTDVASRAEGDGKNEE